MRSDKDLQYEIIQYFEPGAMSIAKEYVNLPILCLEELHGIFIEKMMNIVSCPKHIDQWHNDRGRLKAIVYASLKYKFIDKAKMEKRREHFSLEELLLSKDSESHGGTARLPKNLQPQNWKNYGSGISELILEVGKGKWAGFENTIDNRIVMDSALGRMSKTARKLYHLLNEPTSKDMQSWDDFIVERKYQRKPKTFNAEFISFHLKVKKDEVKPMITEVENALLTEFSVC